MAASTVPEPSMGRADVARLVNERFAKWIERPAADGRARVIRTTSGTTGGAPMMFLREYTDDAMAWFEGSERILALFGSMQVRLTYALYFAKAPAQGRLLVLDSRDFAPGLAPLAEEFAPDTLIGWPFVILAAAKWLGNAAQGIRAIRATGELFGARIERLVRARFPRASLHAQYITGETGFISSMSCAHVSPRFFHPAAGVAVELFEPDETGAGDVVVSKSTGGVSFERYRIGDVARRVSTARCPCGATETFELLGRRGYDYLKVAGALLVREEFDRLAARCADLFDSYRAEVSEIEEEGEVRGKVVLRVFRGSGASRALEREIAARYERELFVGASHTLGDLVRARRFAPVEVVFEKDPPQKGHKDVALRYV